VLVGEGDGVLCVAQQARIGIVGSKVPQQGDLPTKGGHYIHRCGIQLIYEKLGASESQQLATE